MKLPNIRSLFRFRHKVHFSLNYIWNIFMFAFILISAIIILFDALLFFNYGLGIDPSIKELEEDSLKLNGKLLELATDIIRERNSAFDRLDEEPLSVMNPFIVGSEQQEGEIE